MDEFQKRINSRINLVSAIYQQLEIMVNCDLEMFENWVKGQELVMEISITNYIIFWTEKSSKYLGVIFGKY